MRDGRCRSLRIHRRLTEVASEWEAQGREPSLLYKGVRLANARDWAAGGRARLNDLEQAFLTFAGETGETGESR